MAAVSVDLMVRAERAVIVGHKKSQHEAGFFDRKSEISL